MIKRIRNIQFIIRTIIVFSFLTLMFALKDKFSIFELAIYVVLPGIILLTINWFIFNHIIQKNEIK